jgi:hypothetical protein
MKTRFVVGDRVLCVKSYFHQAQGTIGTVMEIVVEPPAWPITVNWDSGECNIYMPEHLERATPLFPGADVQVICSEYCALRNTGSCGVEHGTPLRGTFSRNDRVSTPGWRSDTPPRIRQRFRNEGERFVMASSIEIVRISLPGSLDGRTFMCLRGACAPFRPPVQQAFLFDMAKYEKKKEKAKR